MVINNCYESAQQIVRYRRVKIAGINLVAQKIIDNAHRQDQYSIEIDQRRFQQKYWRLYKA